MLDLFDNKFDHFPGVLKAMPNLACLDVGIPVSAELQSRCKTNSVFFQISKTLVPIPESSKCYELLKAAIIEGADVFKRASSSVFEMQVYVHPIANGRWAVNGKTSEDSTHVDETWKDTNERTCASPKIDRTKGNTYCK